MAQILSQTGIDTANTIEAWHVTQSIDAFTGVEAYDITLSGSFNMTGPINGEPGLINPLTASYAISVESSSYALTASFVVSASHALFITSSNVYGPYGSNSIVSSSYSLSSSFSTSSSLSTSSSFANTASYVNTLNQNVLITDGLSTSGSITRRYRIITVTDSDISTSGTQIINSTDDIVLVIDQTTVAPSPTQATIDLTAFLQSTAGRCIEIIRMETTGTGAGIVVTAGTMAGQALMLNNSSEIQGNRAICGAVGNSVTLMSLGTALTGSIWGNGY